MLSSEQRVVLPFLSSFFLFRFFFSLMQLQSYFLAVLNEKKHICQGVPSYHLSHLKELSHLYDWIRMPVDSSGNEQGLTNEGGPQLENV